MSIKDLLRDVPSLDEWAISRDNPESPRGEDVWQLSDAYSREFSVHMPAFDDDGWPTMPPDQHIVDAFARAWIPSAEDAAHGRADFGTVAVTAERVECDLCGWGAARYESRVGPRRDSANLCLCCLVTRGDPTLGAGHSVMMLGAGQLPGPVLDALSPYLTDQARAAWRTPRCGDGWDAYREWGFVGPDEAGRSYAVILNVQLSVEVGPLNSVAIVAQRAGTRHFYSPGRTVHHAPTSDDWLDVRAILLKVLRGECGSTGRARDGLDGYFRISPQARDWRAIDALRNRDGGAAWLKLGDRLFTQTGDFQMAAEAAKSSVDPELLARLARDHWSPSIRHDAVANRSLSPAVLAEVAAARDLAVADALLDREDLPAAATAQVVEALLLAGELSHFAVFRALRRPDFPARLLATVIQRISAEGTQARIELAREAHAVPGEVRDQIHLQLLLRARKVRSTLELVDGVIGVVPGRREWLSEREEWKVRDLLAWRLTQGSDPTDSASPPNDASGQTPLVGRISIGARTPRSRRGADGGLLPRERSIALSPLSIGHMQVADLQAITMDDEFTEATQAGAAEELARRQAAGESVDMAQEHKEWPDSTVRAMEIIPAAWLKWASQASPPEGEDGNTPG